MSTSTARSVARSIAWALAASATYVGVWAMGWPHSFFTSFPGLGQTWVAPLGPFNEHLVRDVGGLYVALAVFSVWAAATGGTGALRTLGGAWLAFGLPHLAFHATHRHGFSTVEWAASMTPLTFSALAAALLVLLRSKGSDTAGHPTPQKEQSR